MRMKKDEPGAWPLAGWRVVDLSRNIAGPYCSKMLVDAGAEIVKVENPAGGDHIPAWTASGSLSYTQLRLPTNHNL